MPMLETSAETTHRAGNREPRFDRLKGNEMSDATKRWLTEDEQRVVDRVKRCLSASSDANSSDLLAVIDRLCADRDKQQEVIDAQAKTIRNMTAAAGMSPADEACRVVIKIGKEAAAAARAGEGRG